MGKKDMLAFINFNSYDECAIIIGSAEKEHKFNT